MTDIDRSIIQALRKGDHQAYKTVIDCMLGPVHGFLYRLCRDSDTASDLTQETFLAVWQGIETYKGKSKFSTWVFGIAYHRFLRHRDRNRIQTVEYQEDQYSGADDSRTAVERISAKSQVDDAISHLPDIYREVVILIHMNGLTYRETGEVLGISTGTVKSRMNAAFRMLRKILEGSEENESTMREPESQSGWRTESA